MIFLISLVVFCALSYILGAAIANFLRLLDDLSENEDDRNL